MRTSPDLEIKLTLSHNGPTFVACFTILPMASTTSTPDSSLRSPRLGLNGDDDANRDSIIRRSWHAMSDLMSPFTPSALASLPKKTFRRRPRYTRADNVPEASQDEQGQMPTVRDYHAINSLPPRVRVPKKIATPIKVEGKVWFANERSMFSDISCSKKNNAHLVQT